MKMKFGLFMVENNRAQYIPDCHGCQKKTAEKMA
jgi:hypothetical protein